MSSNVITTGTEEDGKVALVPKLRFPKFRGTEGWKSEKVDELVNTVTPPKKLQTSVYTSLGEFPIIDQSQSDICGWTDDKDAIIHDSLPLIVFGDHTCILKLIARPFAQGADGIKILKSRPIVGTPYLYQFLSYRPVVTEEYKRHYSILKEKTVFFPEFKSGEQQKIAECLSSVDEVIAAQARKVDALKTHKKGLMQQLFPREGETQPRLRFPEFQDAGEWEVKPFGELLDDIIDFRGRTPVKLGMQWGGGQITSLSANNVKNGFIDYEAECNWGSEELYQRWMGDVQLEKNDIIFTMEAPLGKALLLPDSHKYILSQRVVAFKTKPNVRNSFLIQLIWSKGFQKAIDELATGSTAKGINQKALKTVPVQLPEIPEQQRIAECLSSLDALITAETQKLAALKLHKRGLMQQLFPSEEAEA